jgi:CheY-like chemotaxis protein
MKNTPQTHKKIFSVDDDPEMLTLIAMLLEQEENMQIHQFADALSALNAMRNLRPDLVLLDVAMPEMDGITAYKKIRENEEWRGVKVAFVTGNKSLAFREQYEALGVPFIAKPFDPTAFQNFVRSIL